MKLTKFLAIGPGGMKCACCFPPPGRRKAEFRSAERKEEIQSNKEVQQETDAYLNGELEAPELWDIHDELQSVP